MNISGDPEEGESIPYDDPLPEDESIDVDRPLHEILGIEPNFAPDELAPPVDEDRLLAFVREQLSPQEREEVLCLIARFRPWLRGWANAMHRSIQEDDPPPE